jgi:hypothetical protein
MLTNHTYRLIEIKPEGATIRESLVNKAKWAAAEAACRKSKRPTTFVVVGYKELEGT